MNRDDVIRLARNAGWAVREETLPMIANLIIAGYEAGAAAEREKVAAWMIAHLYATGHGDTTEDMLEELEWQIAEREREACARMCEVEYAACWHNSAMAAAKAAERCATAIRLRGGK